MSDGRSEQAAEPNQYAPLFSGLGQRFHQLIDCTPPGAPTMKSNSDRTLVQHFEALTGVLLGVDAVWGGLEESGSLGPSGLNSAVPSSHESREYYFMLLYDDDMLTYDICRHITATVPDEPYPSDDPTSMYPTLTAALVRIAARCRAPLGYDITKRLADAIGALTYRSPAAFDAAVDQMLVLFENDALAHSTMPAIWEAVHGKPDLSYAWEQGQIVECVTTVHGPFTVLEELRDGVLSKRQLLAGGVVEAPPYDMAAIQVIVEWLTAQADVTWDCPNWNVGTHGDVSAPTIEFTYEAPPWGANSCWRAVGRMYPSLLFVSVFEGSAGSGMVVTRRDQTLYEGVRDDKLVAEMVWRATSGEME